MPDTKYYLISYEYTNKLGILQRITATSIKSPTQLIFDFYKSNIFAFLIFAIEISEDDYFYAEEILEQQRVKKLSNTDKFIRIKQDEIYTVEQLEAAFEPFIQADQSWIAFKSKMLPGDIIRGYDDIGVLSGSSGLNLIRGNHRITSMVLFRS